MIRNVKSALVSVSFFALCACGDSAGIEGSWVGTLADGEPVALEITQGAPDVEGELTVEEFEDRPVTGTFVDGALDVNANDDMGAINFNATVSGDSMTGSFVTARVAVLINTGGSFTMTKQ